MTVRSYSLQLDGTVSLDRFADAVDAWRLTLDAASSVVGEAHVLEVTVEELSVGSALIVTSVRFDTPHPADGFSAAVLEIAALPEGGAVDLTSKQEKARQRLLRVASQEPGGVVVSTGEADVLVPAQDPSTMAGRSVAPASSSVETQGELRGRLQSLSSRTGLRAVLYDDLFDRAVRLVLTPDQHEILRSAWDTAVVIDGVIRRDQLSGRPLSMPQVWRIRPQPAVPDNLNWLDAYGALADVEPGVPSEDLIAQARRG